MVTVACVFWGDKFSEDYVYNLKSAVQRNTTIQHKFICLSDRMLPGIDTILLKPGFTGWWNKLQLFDGRIDGHVVYLDLDTLIVDNIDWLLSYKGAFAGIEDLGSINSHQSYLKGKLQSGILAFDARAAGWIWDVFFFDHHNITKAHRGDGEYLNSAVSNRDLLQSVYPSQIKSYKYQVYPNNIDGASIVCFHGRPSIVQSISEIVTTARDKYLPQSWIQDHWR